MRFRTTLILLGLVIVAALFFAFHTGRQLSDIEYDIQQRRVFRSAEYAAPGDARGDLTQRAVRLEIGRGENAVTLERARPGGPWLITEPTRTGADPVQVDDTLAAIESLEALRTLRSDETGRMAMATYGLDRPDFVVGFATPEQKFTLLIGSLSLDGRTRYVARPDQGDRVYVVAQATVARIAKSLSELRDRLLLRFDPNRLKTIAVSVNSGPLFTLRRGEDGWRITDPVDDAADPAAVGELLTPLVRTALAPEAFIADRPEALSRYGLAPPLVTMAAAEDGRTVRLLAGAKASEHPGTVYAMRGGESCVFLLPESLVGRLLPPLRELRSKSALSFAPEDVMALEIRLPSGRVRLVLEGLAWSCETPSNLTPDPERVLAFLNVLRAIKVVEWLDDVTPQRLEEAGLHRPAAEVRLALRSGATPTLRFGRRKVGEGLVFARRDDRGPILLLPDEALDDLKGGPLIFRSRVVLRLRPSDISALEIVRPGRKIALSRRGGAWQLVEPVEGPANAGNVEELLDKLCYLETPRLVAGAPCDLSRYGLDHPGVRVRLASEGEMPQRSSRTLLVGNDAGEEGVYAMMEGGDVFILPAAVMKRLNAEFATDVVSSFNPEKVRAIEIRSRAGSAAVRLERRGHAWQVASPGEARGATRTALQLLGSLADLRAESVAAYDGAACDLSEFGLAQPWATIRIELDDGVVRVLHVGDARGGLHHVVAEDLPYVFRVQAQKLRPVVDALSRYGPEGGAAATGKE